MYAFFILSIINIKSNFKLKKNKRHNKGRFFENPIDVINYIFFRIILSTIFY